MLHNKQLREWLSKDVDSRIRCSGKHKIQKIFSGPIYRSNSKKGWINSAIFEELSLFMDNNTLVEPGSVLLMDNYGAHILGDEHTSRLKKVRHAFFPPNVTSHYQPLDQGIFWALKSRYKLFI